MGLKIKLNSIMVSDQDKALKFYTEVLGFVKCKDIPVGGPYRWLTVNESSSPFSFLNVCQLLNLEPDNVRNDLVGDSSLGALSYWARRCGRAAGRLRTSFRHFFVNDRNGHAQPGDMIFNNASSAAGACLHENVN